MPNFLINILAENIRIVLARKGWTQAELARRAGIKAQHLSKWMVGKNYPSPKNLFKIGSVLEVPVEQLTSDNSKPITLNPRETFAIRKLIQEELEFEMRKQRIKDRRLGTSGQSMRWDFSLEFPKLPEGLTEEESYRWNMNELALRRWAETHWGFNISTWTIEKFCQEAIGPYDDGNLQKITGILQEFIKEDPAEKKS